MWGRIIVSTLGILLKKSMHGRLTHDKIDKTIIGKNTMKDYVQTQLEGTTLMRDYVKAPPPATMNKTMEAV